MTLTERINRARRCLVEKRGVVAGDLAAVLDRLDDLERDLAAAAGLRRKANRNRAVVALVGIVAPGLPARKAARRLRAVAQTPDDLPREAVELLDKINRDGGMPSTDRMLANIIQEIRTRNEREI